MSKTKGRLNNLITEERISRIADPVKRSIMYNRYVLGKTWEAVALGRGYTSTAYIHLLNKEALKEIQRMERVDRGGENAKN